MSQRAAIAAYMAGFFIVMWLCAWLVDLVAPGTKLEGRVLFLLFMCIATAAFVGAFALERKIRR